MVILTDKSRFAEAIGTTARTFSLFFLWFGTFSHVFHRKTSSKDEAFLFLWAKHKLKLEYREERS
jgi:hypothetical protein